tara:strand:+ start:514 stop:1635 length:1122 start_codon:yes stop_codon:yes gene_type:complete
MTKTETVGLPNESKLDISYQPKDEKPINKVSVVTESDEGYEVEIVDTSTKRNDVELQYEDKLYKRNEAYWTNLINKNKKSEPFKIKENIQEAIFDETQDYRNQPGSSQLLIAESEKLSNNEPVLIYEKRGSAKSSVLGFDETQKNTPNLRYLQQPANASELASQGLVRGKPQAYIKHPPNTCVPTIDALLYLETKKIKPASKAKGGWYKDDLDAFSRMCSDKDMKKVVAKLSKKMDFSKKRFSINPRECSVKTVNVREVSTSSDEALGKAKTATTSYKLTEPSDVKTDKDVTHSKSAPATGDASSSPSVAPGQKKQVTTPEKTTVTTPATPQGSRSSRRYRAKVSSVSTSSVRGINARRSPLGAALMARAAKY